MTPRRDLPKTRKSCTPWGLEHGLDDKGPCPSRGPCCALALRTTVPDYAGSPRVLVGSVMQAATRLGRKFIHTHNLIWHNRL